MHLALLFKAASEGDLRTAKILYNRQPRVDVEARNSDGKNCPSHRLPKGSHMMEELGSEEEVKCHTQYQHYFKRGHNY